MKCFAFIFLNVVFAQNSTSFQNKLEFEFKLLDLEYNNIVCPTSECSITSDKFSEICQPASQTTIPSYNCGREYTHMCSMQMRGSGRRRYSISSNTCTPSVYGNTLICCNYGSYGGFTYLVPLCFTINKTKQVITSCPITSNECNSSYSNIETYNITINSVMSQYTHNNENNLMQIAILNYTTMKQSMCNWLKYGVACQLSIGKSVTFNRVSVAGTFITRINYILLLSLLYMHI